MIVKNSFATCPESVKSTGRHANTVLGEAAEMRMAQILPRHALLGKANPSIPTETLALLLKMLSVLQISSELCVYPPGITGCSLDVPLKFFPPQQMPAGLR